MNAREATTVFVIGRLLRSKTCSVRGSLNGAPFLLQAGQLAGVALAADFGLASCKAQVIIRPPRKAFDNFALQGGSAMSTTLNLVDHLLSRGRHLQEIGREQDALHVLERLACFRQLPPKVAEETQVRLAELLLERGEF